MSGVICKEAELIVINTMKGEEIKVEYTVFDIKVIAWLFVKRFIKSFQRVKTFSAVTSEHRENATNKLYHAKKIGLL